MKKIIKNSIAPPKRGQPYVSPSGKPASPGTAPIAPSQPQATTNSGIVPTKMTAVKKLQEAIQSLSKTILEYTKKDSSGEAGKTSFNDFITQQYMSKSSTQGVEYSTDAKITNRPDKDKSKTSLFQMNPVLDTLQRIGKQTSEFRTDGTWDFRTVNALKNITALGDALIKLKSDFGANFESAFSASDLNFMKSKLPDEDTLKTLTPAVKEKLAAAFTVVVEKINTFFQFFVDKVFYNPNNYQFISGKAAFDKVTNNTKTHEEQSAIDLIKSNKDPDGLQLAQKGYLNTVKVNIKTSEGNEDIEVPLTAFKDINSFKAFVNEAVQFQTDPQSLMKVLNQLEATLRK